MNRDFAKTPDVIFDAIARLRWPNYAVRGIGRIAVVRKCSETVVLCSWPLEAQTKRAERCCDDCSHQVAPDMRWHYIQLLNEPKPELVIRIRNRALMEHD